MEIMEAQKKAIARGTWYLLSACIIENAGSTG